MSFFFRSGPADHFESGGHATAHVIVDSTMLLRIDALTGRSKAFLNMSSQDLQSGSALLLSSTKTIIELTDQSPFGAETVRACQELQRAGYQLALDCFQDDANWRSLLPYATFLKIDCGATPADEQKSIVKEFSRNNLRIIGKRIETREEFRSASDAGIPMFQGFFFLRPELVATRDLPASKFNCLELLRESAAPELRYGEIERILEQEPSLLYKLLRCLNSPAIGLYREVHSVPHAVALLREREFRRWVGVVAVVAASFDEPVEVLRSALTRAYFCEGLSLLLFDSASSSEFFLMGLISLMDVLFSRPLDEVLAELPVSQQIHAALLGERNVFRDVYDAALTYEQADWVGFRAAAGRAKLDQSKVTEKYEAAIWQASSIEVGAG